MRRMLVCVLVAATAVLVASPAAAQRDPFEPQIETGEAPGGSEQASEEEPAPAPEPQVGPGVANTGLDGRPWLALAYVLVALGVGLIAVDRLRRLPE